MFCYLHVPNNKYFLFVFVFFFNFGEYKVVIANGRIKNYTFNLHHNVLIKNDTAFEGYWNQVENSVETIIEKGYTILGIPIVEIIVWNMDLYANKKIKISKNALTGQETLILYEKHSDNIKGVNLKKKKKKKRFF